jgi:hypothetical protein
VTSRSYILQAGRPIAVEVDGAPDVEAISAEVRRLYGPFRVQRWARRGRKRRAEVVRDEKPKGYGLIGLVAETPKGGRDWWCAP